MFSKKSLSIFLAAVMTLGLLVGCSQQAANTESTATPTAVSSETREFVDSAGRKVQIPVQIDRIAPSGSLAQIMLFALCPDKLVGLSGKWSADASGYLAEKYLKLPVFGQFYGTSDLNKEALAAANPQLIIDIGEKKSSIVEDMDSIQDQLGIPVVFIEASLEKSSACFQTLGDLLGVKDDAKVLSDYCSQVYTTTVDKMKQIGDQKVRLLYCLGEKGTNVIGKGSYHAEILDLLGDNVAVIDNPSSKGTGNEVSAEQITQWDPDVVIFAPDSIYDTAAGDSAWAQLKAIKNKNYYKSPGSPYCWMGFPPSVNRYMGMIWLSELLYPDQFSYDLKAETVKFYKLFYHCDLTDAQYDALVKGSLKN